MGAVPSAAGLYLLFERDTGDIVYIGQSADCSKRLRSHAMKFLDEQALMFFYYSVERSLLPHNLKEWENDLIGNYFEVYRKTPKYQFGNMHS
jgi:excinuclease UvrABC nuclease subunit